MKRFVNIKCILWVVFVGVGTLVLGQPSLTLEEAYELARSNYPLLKSVDIYKVMEERVNELVDQNRKPAITVKGDASLQSEAISLGEAGGPIYIDVPIYRAQAYGEVTYNLFDGGISDVQKQINEINTIIQTQQIEVNLYPLKEQVNSIFTGVELARKLTAIFILTEKDLETRRKVLQAGVDNGVTLESELTKLEVRLLQLENERLKVDADVGSAYSLLSVITGRTIEINTNLVLPKYLTSTTLTEVHRPELTLFSNQKMAFEAQKKLINAMDIIHVKLFGQVGLSYPNYLNFTDVSLSPYALGGIKASYKLFDKKNRSIKNQKLDLQAQLIDVKEETFKHNLNVQSARYQNDFQLLSDQVDKYNKIAELQSQILVQLNVQLDNGIITSSEYLLQSTEELRARQNVKITQSKLNQKRLEYLTIYGIK